MDICSNEGDLDVNLIFLYNTQKILILNAEDHSEIIGEVFVSEQGKNSERYTEFHRIPAISYIVYNKSDHELYFMIPDMTIGCVVLSKIGNEIHVSDPQVIISPESNLHLTNCLGVEGYSIIRYNQETGRLYWVVNGTNSTGSGGGDVNCFFGIYNRDASFSFTEVISPDIYESSNIDIYDVAYNKDNSDQNGYRFYLSKDNVWEINLLDGNNSYNNLATKDIDPLGYYESVKNGWFLYGPHEQNNHKIFCMPHDNHFASNPNVQHEVFVIDGQTNGDTFSSTSIELPDSRVIYSGAYLQADNHIVFSVLPSSTEALLYRYDADNYQEISEINLDSDRSNICKHIVVDKYGHLILGRKDGVTIYYDPIHPFENVITNLNNYYFKTIITDIPNSNTTIFTVMSPISSGIDEIVTSSGSTYTQNIPTYYTGQPVYSAEYNPLNGNIYFYNRSNFENGRIYSINTDLEVSTINDFASAIGNCVFNPYAQELLIATFSDQGEIRTYDVSNNFIQSVLSTNYTENLLITTDGRLVYTENMVHSNGNHTKINICDASTYISLGSFIDNYNWDLAEGTRLKSTIAFNRNDKQIVAFISPVQYMATNNLENTSENGIYLKIDQNNTISSEVPPDVNPRKAIFCGPDNSLVVSSGSGYCVLNNLSGWDYYRSDINIWDMTFNSQTNKLYIIGDNSTGSKLWEVDGSNLVTQNELFDFGSLDLKSCVLFLSEGNNSLLSMAYPLGINTNREIKCFEFDLSNNFSYQEIQTGNQLTSGRDIYFHYQHNQFIHDPYSMRVFYPNGMFSDINLFQYENESLLLNNQEWVWLSVPRMDRIQNEVVGINDVFSNENLDAGNFIIGTTLKNLPLGEQDEIINVYQGTQWDPQGDLSEIQSTLGYKLKFEYATGYQSPDQKWLHLEGSVLDPDYANLGLAEAPKENWLGYYLYQEQSPFDAISDEDLEHIYSIKGQYWACGKFWGDGIPEPYWVCQCYKGKSVRLKYGDMAVIKTYQEIDFRWQLFGTPLTDNTDRLESENFTFTEQADYTPIFIELDSTVKPLEIGAFVEDVCVGATSVFPDDTLVLVPAYTEGISGEIYFEYYYGSNKMHTPPISEYYVKSNRHKQIEQRTIHTSDISDYFLVSLKKPEAKESPGKSTNAWIKCNPNPLRSGGTVSFYIPHDGYTEIKLYNIFGVEQMILYSGVSNMGTHQLSIDGKDANNNNLPNGTYILSLKSFKSMSQSKIIVLR